MTFRLDRFPLLLLERVARALACTALESEEAHPIFCSCSLPCFSFQSEKNCFSESD